MEKVKVDYLVEADNTAELLVYMLLKEKVSFTQALDHQNKGIFAGKTKENPNMVSITFSYIDNKLVCFYWGTSQIVNHKEIDILLENYFEYGEKMEADSFVIKMLGNTL